MLRNESHTRNRRRLPGIHVRLLSFVEHITLQLFIDDAVKSARKWHAPLRNSLDVAPIVTATAGAVSCASATLAPRHGLSVLDHDIAVRTPILDRTGLGSAHASLKMPLLPRCGQRELAVDVPACAAWIPTETVQILSRFTSLRVNMLHAQRCRTSLSMANIISQISQRSELMPSLRSTATRSHRFRLIQFVASVSLQSAMTGSSEVSSFALGHLARTRC